MGLAGAPPFGRLVRRHGRLARWVSARPGSGLIGGGGAVTTECKLEEKVGHRGKNNLRPWALPGRLGV